jgi:hypothetical protein
VEERRPVIAATFKNKGTDLLSKGARAFARACPSGPLRVFLGTRGTSNPHFGQKSPNFWRFKSRKIPVCSVFDHF